MEVRYAETVILSLLMHREDVQEVVDRIDSRSGYCKWEITNVGVSGWEIVVSSRYESNTREAAEKLSSVVKEIEAARRMYEIGRRTADSIARRADEKGE